MIKESIYQEDKTIIKVFIPNKSLKTHKAKADITERRNTQLNSNC